MEVKGYRVRNIRDKWYAVVDYKDGNVRRQKSKALTACSEEEAGCMAMDLFYRCKAGLEPIKKNGATVQSVLGHSSAAITLDMYASADANAKKNAAGIIGAAL